VGVEGSEGGLHVLLGSLSRHLVVLHDSHAGESPGAAGGQNLAVGPAHPLDNLGSGGSVGSSPELLIGHIVGDRVGLGQQGSIASLESWHLSKWELLCELGGLVGLTENKVGRHLNLSAAVFSSNQCLLGPEVVGVCVKRPCNHDAS